MSTREDPDDCKKAIVALIFKDQKDNLRSYRPVSLTLTHKKAVESSGECFWTHEGESN